MPKRPDSEIIEDLKDIECQLSPENLSCDGECSAFETRSRERALKYKQKQLIKELGREPTNRELW